MARGLSVSLSKREKGEGKDGRQAGSQGVNSLGQLHCPGFGTLPLAGSSAEG
ncbi:MAG: hypothetical protein LBU69_00540 [Deltaproteobacteria bacterium]|nr:hypothetical protein [Deltaproteobacteria bacterium]